MLNLFKKDPTKNKQRTEEGVRRTRETWFGKIMGVLRASGPGEELWDELEEILVSADLGVETSLDLIGRLKDRAAREHLDRPQEVLEHLKEELAASLSDDGEEALWDDSDQGETPYVILVVGVNGVGKTTSIAKLAHRFQEEGKKVLIGAADTFRAAASEQLHVLGSRIGVDVISHQAGADPGAVAYDAYQAARSRGVEMC